MTVFESPRPTKDPSVANVSVTVQPNMPGIRSAGKDEKLGHLPVRNLWAMTDSASLKELDPSTLEPIGLSSQKALHPDLKGPLSCAHTMSDPATGDVYNYNLALGPNPTYRIFRTSAATGETEILAVLSGKGVKPAYLHSFFMTEDFVILCIWNAHFSHKGLKILSEQNLLDAISPFDKSEPNRWFVVDRKHGHGVVAEFQSPAAFCFHTVNAWQVGKDGKTDIMCEYVEYENTDVLHSLYYSNLLSSSEQAVTFNDEKGESSLGCLTQYRLSDIGNSPLKHGKDVPTAERVLQIPKRMAGDLPTINPNFEMRVSRYVYTTIHRGFSAFVDGLSKVDTVTKEVSYWDNQKGHTPGEAIFVPDPEGVNEDDGVLLSVVLDGFKETSYLVCLDARTMEEIGRADCGCPVGFGFHGAHIKA
jgi:torulene dioxygenase